MASQITDNSLSLVFHEGNPSVIVGAPSHRARNAGCISMSLYLYVLYNLQAITMERNRHIVAQAGFCPMMCMIMIQYIVMTSGTNGKTINIHLSVFDQRYI